MIDDDAEDLLMHRLLSGSATDDDWRSAENAVAEDGGAAARLVAALRDDVELRRAASALDAGSRRVEAPAPRMLRESPWRGAAGWIAAAALACATGVAWALPREAARVGRPIATNAESLSELSPLLVETRPTADRDGVEVWSVKRTLQREVIRSLQEVTYDDAGNPCLRSVDTVPGTQRSAL